MTNPCLVRIELAGARCGLSEMVARFIDPARYGASIQPQLPGDLLRLQALLFAIITNLAEGLVADHEGSPKVWRSISRKDRSPWVAPGEREWVGSEVGNGVIAGGASSANT